MRLPQLLAAAAFVVSYPAFSQEPWESYFPFSVGAKWVYSIDVIVHDVGSRQRKFEVRIDGEEVIHGIRYYREVSYSGLARAESTISFRRVGKSGVFEIREKHKGEDEVLDVPFPLMVGRAWTTHKEDLVIGYRMEGYQTLELLRKEYNDCLKISVHHGDKEGAIDGVIYYAKDVGLVRYVLRSQELTTDIVLEKYEK